ncbi:MAG TPA: patatin-like phospholipase family protein [Ktedonobacterales bacterium]|nr:patatin-like phospholipase family protein [Ktedonobacterales bacterium]
MDESEQGRDLLSHNHASHDGQAVDHASTRRTPQWYGYTAFVLSGGGARGALQVGAVRALLEAGIQPDVLIGTSIGAWNASVLARFPFDEALERMTEAWRRSQPAQILLGRESGSSMPPHQALTGVLMLSAIRRVTQGYPSLYSDTGQKRLIADLLDDVTFEELRLPLRVIASDLIYARHKIFDSGPVAPAVLASSAIPGIFPPVRIGASVYVDGGALDNTNVELALKLGARRIFLLDVGYDATNDDPAFWARAVTRNRHERHHDKSNHASDDKPREPTMHPLAAVLERTIQVMSAYQRDRAISRVPPGVQMNVLRLSTGTGDGMLVFGKAEDWMERGYTQTEEYLRATATATSEEAGRGAAVSSGIETLPPVEALD